MTPKPQVCPGILSPACQLPMLLLSTDLIHSQHDISVVQEKKKDKEINGQSKTNKQNQ